jgi:hypothetical protein
MPYGIERPGDPVVWGYIQIHNEANREIKWVFSSWSQHRAAK